VFNLECSPAPLRGKRIRPVPPEPIATARRPVHHVAIPDKIKVPFASANNAANFPNDATPGTFPPILLPAANGPFCKFPENSCACPRSARTVKLQISAGRACKSRKELCLDTAAARVFLRRMCHHGKRPCCTWPSGDQHHWGWVSWRTQSRSCRALRDRRCALFRLSASDHYTAWRERRTKPHPVASGQHTRYGISRKKSLSLVRDRLQ